MKRSRSSITAVECEWSNQLFDFIITEYQAEKDIKQIGQFVVEANRLCRDYYLDTFFALTSHEHPNPFTIEEMLTLNFNRTKVKVKVNNHREFKSEEFLVDFINRFTLYNNKVSQLATIQYINEFFKTHYSRIRLVPTVEERNCVAVLISKRYKK